MGHNSTLHKFIATFWQVSVVETWKWLAICIGRHRRNKFRFLEVFTPCTSAILEGHWVIS